jgi:PilZ domain
VCRDETAEDSSSRLWDCADMGRSVLRPYEEKTGGETGQAAAEPSATGAKQRRSGRVSLQVPVVIMGTDGEGRVFAEETHTVVVSRYGAGIVSRHKLMPEQELIFRAVELQREAEVRVVGEIGRQGAVYTYGLAFLDEARDFWQREFPAPLVWDRQPEVLVLECGACKGVEEVKNGDFEYDICAIHGGLVRFCEECGYLPVWRQAQDALTGLGKVKKKEMKEVKEVQEIKQVSKVEEAKEAFVSLADAMEGADRRARVRAKVKFFACVVSPELGEDVVTCVDMSKGGVSFRTKKEYAKDLRVTIAVPYAPEAKEAPAIFVKGRIANVKAVGDGMWRVGLEFLR